MCDECDSDKKVMTAVYPVLKEARDRAVREKKDRFTFLDRVVMVDYADYILGKLREEFGIQET